MQKLIIEQSAIEAIVNNGQLHYPNEIYGFVFGQNNAIERIISQILISNNPKPILQKGDGMISNQELEKAIDYGHELGLELVGIFQTHLNYAAIPSENDLLINKNPFYSNLILSVFGGAAAGFTSWRIQNKTHVFEEEQILIPELIAA